MPTTPNYRFLKEVFGGSAGTESYAIYSSSGVNCGDMMQWDLGARVATANVLGSGSVFLGVSQETSPLVSLGTAANPLTNATIRVKSSGIHYFKTTSGETYSHLDAVYQGADQQTVSKVGSTVCIGRVWLPDGTQVTGAAGTNVNVVVMGNMTLNSIHPSSASTAI